MLYVLPCAALAAVLAAYWRCVTLRRALLRERAASRVTHAALARDNASMEMHFRQAAAETAVLTAAAYIVDRAAASYPGHPHQKGGAPDA